MAVENLVRLFYHTVKPEVMQQAKALRIEELLQLLPPNCAPTLSTSTQALGSAVALHYIVRSASLHNSCQSCSVGGL
jgi:hypothetical protein